jgi:AcrR family transcriptional regulator
MSMKRRYNSDARCARAATTKQRVLAAARSLFSSKGFEKTTIDEVAAAAKVSAPTVYSIFKSKEGIVRELLNDILFGARYKSLVEEFTSSEDPRDALKIAASIARTVHDAEKSEMGVIRGASALSPELRKLGLEGENLRYERQQPVIHRLKKAKLLLQGMDAAQARDILWSLTSREIYRMLVIERGWSPGEYQEWLGRTLLKILVKG